jgi:predicted trehalose synthase
MGDVAPRPAPPCTLLDAVALGSGLTLAVAAATAAPGSGSGGDGSGFARRRAAPSAATSGRFAIPLIPAGHSVRAAGALDVAPALVAAMADGVPIPGARGGRLTFTATGAMRGLLAGEEAATMRAVDPGTDQSHGVAVVGGRIFLKLRRRLVPGIDPESELAGFLSGPGAFISTPALAGTATWHDPAGTRWTIALAFARVVGAVDAYEWANALLQSALRDDDEARRRVVVAAGSLGSLVAELHATLIAAGGGRCSEAMSRPASADRAGFAVMPGSAVRAGFATRPATPGEMAALRSCGAAELARARAALRAPAHPAAAYARRRLEAWTPAIRARLAELAATLPGPPPLVGRIHGDLHLGQLLRVDGPRGADAFVVTDFEGDPLVPPAARRRPTTPLRDLASLLRSLDHVTRSAARRAGMDPSAAATEVLIRTLRATALTSYEAAAPVTVDPALLAAVELAKELREITYAVRYLPDWLYAPLGGLAALIGEPLDRRPG